MSGLPQTPGELRAFLRLRYPTPAMDLLGCAPLEADASGVFRAEFMPSAELLNAAGNVHGGQLCAMLDLVTSFAAGAAANFTQTVLTLELKTSFLRRAGRERLVGVGKVRQAGRSVVFLEGELSDSEGRVIATATATAQVRPLQGHPSAGLL